MIEEQFYLTEPGSLDRLIELTDLADDEVEGIVKRFRKDHWRFAGKLKGEVLVYMDGSVTIRHHFTKKKLWSNR